MNPFAEILPTLRQPLASGALASGALAAALVTYQIVRAPARNAGTLGPRGLKRQRALEHGVWFPVFEPSLRWCATRISGLVPEGLCRSLERRLVRAGDFLGLTAEEYVVLLFVGMIGGLFAGYVDDTMYKHGPASYVVGAMLGAFYVQTRIDLETARRAREITHGLPYVTDLLALAMTAGLDFPAAVRNVLERSSDKNDALTDELELVLRQIALGQTRKYALMQFAERTNVPAAVEFAHVVAQADERGSPLAEVLGVQAQVARNKRSANAEDILNKAQQKMFVPLLMMLASVMIMLGASSVILILNTLNGAAPK